MSVKNAPCQNNKAAKGSGKIEYAAQVDFGTFPRGALNNAAEFLLEIRIDCIHPGFGNMGRKVRLQDVKQLRLIGRLSQQVLQFPYFRGRCFAGQMTGHE